MKNLKKSIYTFAIILILAFSSINNSYSWSLSTLIDDVSDTLSFKKELPVTFKEAIYRDDNLLDNDSYKQYIYIYHKSPNPVSGRFIIRAFGDVFGNGGEGSNYKFFDIVDSLPGIDISNNTYFLINNPALRQDNIPDETIEKNTTMRLKIEFQPVASEKEWKATTWTLEINKGQFKRVE